MEEAARVERIRQRRAKLGDLEHRYRNEKRKARVAPPPAAEAHWMEAKRLKREIWKLKEF